MNTTVVVLRTLVVLLNDYYLSYVDSVNSKPVARLFSAAVTTKVIWSLSLKPSASATWSTYINQLLIERFFKQ